MTDRKKRQNPRLNRGKLITGIIKTAIIFIVIAVVGVSVKNIFDLKAENKELKNTNKELQSEKDSLNEELQNVNDKDYIEEQARIQLRMIKPGEIIYILPDEENEKDNENEDDETND